jgi:hypothetical protein
VTKVLDRLAHALATAEQDCVGALRGAQSELVKSEALTTSVGDSGTDGLSETQGGDLESRDFQQTRIVGDGADNDSGLVLLALQVTRQTGYGDRGVVDSGHTQSLHNGVGELGLRTSADEAVEGQKQGTGSVNGQRITNETKKQTRNC